MKPLFVRGSARTCRTCKKTFIAGGFAELCQTCRTAAFRARVGKRQVWTAEMDQKLRDRWGRMPLRQIAQALGISPNSNDAVKCRAAVLGLPPYKRSPRDPQPWTAEEIAVLEEYAGARPVQWIARKLKRSIRAVTIKMHRLQMSARVTAADGYTIDDLVTCMGESPTAIARWISLGYFGHVRYRYGGKAPAFERDPRIITAVQVLTFVREHQDTFRLDRVDQTWFLDLVFNNEANRQERSHGSAA